MIKLTESLAAITELKRLAERAVPGPWAAYQKIVVCQRDVEALRGSAIVADAISRDYATWQCEANAAFIAAAREAVPMLIGRVERAETALRRIAEWKGYAVHEDPGGDGFEHGICDYELGANDMLATLQKIARSALEPSAERRER